jgi:UDP-GlcNAc:undecaprenyl-phosphate GlcNAc-1-phosphate transferase
MDSIYYNLTVIIAFVASIAISAFVIPALKLIAPKTGLLDIPNARKVHQNPVPVVGGLAIGITLIISLLVSPYFIEIINKYYIIISAALLLMLVGILDDKLNLRASHRLTIQLVCAYAIAASGIRLTSMYGIFGIGELNIYVSYAFTLFLIAGVVNAFNLIDGIDGLAGFLALVGLSIFSYLAYTIGDSLLVIILISLIGSVIVFLIHNLGKRKIFLGDGGSLLLGFILVAIGIQLIESANSNLILEVNKTISIVFGVFLIPVLDSIRVYWSRMQEGFSPLRADKRHIHHLFLFFKLSHKNASAAIAISSVLLTCLLILLHQKYGLSSSIVLVSVLFLLITSTLAAIKKLGDWRKKIGELENRD